MRAAIRVERSGETARVVVDHPAKGNSLDSALLEDLAGAFSRLCAEPAPRAVVLTGAGDKAFIGGASLDEMAQLDAASARAFIGRVHGVCDAVRRFPAPVIARVNGYALGAGLEIAVSCDLRIAAAHAVFGMPEVRFAIPSVVEAALLPGLIGRGRAAWLLLTGRTLSAEEALAWGLVERVVPAAGLEREVEATLESILAMSEQAVRAQKALMRLWDERPLEEGIAASIEAFARSYDSGEPNARMREFLAARRKARR